ncbi:hypothetical protein FQN54_004887 [Arachnomyces sp. PD_36]|nr:hypothetical protein FQN54_004887 [Arachnomyces sp. PD_36]
MEPPRDALKSQSLPLLRGSVTLESALEDDDNMLQRLAYPEQRIDFFLYLWTHRSEIETLVSDHLGFSGMGMCRAGEVKDWIAGSFNVCIPVYVDEKARFAKKRVLIRFPLPYKIGESRYPGNADEKLRCEAAAFVWIQDNCPDVPIPFLWGFGFPNGQSFTAPESVPFYTRLMSNLQRTVLSWIGYPVPCRFIRHRYPHALKVGYLLMDHLEETDGNMLSESWEKFRHDRDRRTNLFRDLSHIIHSLARVPLPRIGSFTIDDQGILSLTNRPLTVRLHCLENEGVPTNIDRNLTYSTTDAYLHDLLGYHDSRIRHQPNSIHDEYDGQAQMGALTIMRALHPHFTDRDLRHGPFVFTLTDMHASNIFVDRDWNIKYLIDLEWACSLPIEMLHPPFWLTSRGVDQLEKGEHLDAYTAVHGEFVGSFEKVEGLFPLTNGDASYRTQIMRKGWKIGNFWYFHSLDNPKGLYTIFLQHIQPMFEWSHGTGTDFDRIVAPYWSADAAEVRAAKLRDKELYDDQLRKAFEDNVEEDKN